MTVSAFHGLVIQAAKRPVTRSPLEEVAMNAAASKKNKKAHHHPPQQLKK